MTMTTTDAPLARLGRLMVDQPLIPLTLILLALIAALAILNPAILSLFWVSNTLKIAIPLAMLAACQTLTMLTGGIDLSVGTAATIAAYVTATATPLIGAPSAIGIAMGCTLLIGVVNGIGIAFARVHPLIMTLGTGLIATGTNSPAATSRIPARTCTGRPRAAARGAAVCWARTRLDA